MTATQEPWVKKAKWLTQALIISCTLNVGLLTTFLYFAMTDSRGSSDMPKPIKESLGLQNTLAQYQTLSFQDLLLRLGNKDQVEAGCTRRDLALACLVYFHHFNLEKALGGVTLQKQDLTYHAPSGEPIRLVLHPGLADYQFQAILQYAKTEKWPLTSEGLFQRLKIDGAPFAPSLLEAFALTQEVHFINLLFSKTGIHLKKEYLAALLAQGEWSILSETAEHLKQSSAFTESERRHFLLRLLEAKSKIAAKILVETDQEYCFNQLDEGQIISLCTLLRDKTPTAFLRALLQNPRSDEIWKTAAAILYDQAAEDVPSDLNLNATKRRFIDLEATPRPQKKGRTYKVQSGDSLWKIARQHDTSVQALRAANNLKSDTLNIGQTLVIP
jgi:hypothetical protein